MTRPVHGLRAWIIQRVSALYLLGFCVYLAGMLSVHPPSGYEAWRAWVGHPAASVAFGLFFLALLAHVWVGLRDVILDYASVLGVRFALLMVVGVSLLGLAIWVGRILLLAAMQ